MSDNPNDMVWIANTEVDLTNCDREPIHIPDRIQPHGVLLVLEPGSLKIIQVSDNVSRLLGLEPHALLTYPLSSILDDSLVTYLQQRIEASEIESNPLYLFTTHVPPSPHTSIPSRLFDGIAHTFDGLIILELEPTHTRDAIANIDSYRMAKIALNRIQSTISLQSFFDAAADQIRSLTGFDRVMIYRFLEDGSGTVIAESRRTTLIPYLGLHYPASDIPRQARALYKLNWLRIIPDIKYTPSELLPPHNPLTNKPLDMSYMVLRSVSPIHVEYLVNMGVDASMSISLMRGEDLWGLIACHHESGPKYIPYDVRTACEFLGQVVSAQIAAREEQEEYSYQMHLKSMLPRLVGLMSATNDPIEGLIGAEPNLLSFIRASGAAVCLEGRIQRVGLTPPQAAIREIVTWLANEHPDEIAFVTNSLAKHYDPAHALQNTASGILAIAIAHHSHDYVLWFRPEVIQTVSWAGDPHKPVEIIDGGMQLSPRTSFELWKETVRHSSLPWKPWEVEAARDLRTAIVDIVLRKADELRRLNRELARSNAELDAFAYIASHDLKEPLRNIHHYSQFLIEDYSDQIDQAGSARLHSLIRLTNRMESLIESLLHYSRIGRLDMAFDETDLHEIVQDVLERIALLREESGAEIRLPRRLPLVYCDRVRIGEVFYNLITNALKYNTKEHRWVEIGFLDPPPPRRSFDADGTPRPERTRPMVFYVRDNGIGIREKHLDMVFSIFKRLHTTEEFGEGTGAGLTITCKIIERHGGRIWLESTYGQGTTFFFTLQPSESTSAAASEH